ncbi:hypothetical protein GLX27_002889 [Malassezia furfur]|mgnify:CR=1 FL=1|uniref:Uncharacterized protein n=1 Tax=Malassezia furfur TaxID=55194 RepID=A0ABY8ERK1_MALFU|nr:hypothetical protein CBS14141_002543 [Malassezia furfur]WFD48221.1 hypothetical protein GLX27_002889 [Malassezia furfur]
MHHLSNLKCNATGLAPEHSMVLPERDAVADEDMVMAGLLQLYTAFSEELMVMFAPEVLYTMPNGSVVVGTKAVAEKFAALTRMNPGRTVRQRLLQTPESLPRGAMVVDQLVTSTDEMQPATERNLIVIKRREQDGLIASLTEEAGHRKATVPLAARAASANVFNSPTDNMVSPCTSKLNLTKRRHHLKGKPTALFAGMTGPSYGL